MPAKVKTLRNKYVLVHPDGKIVPTTISKSLDKFRHIVCGGDKKALFLLMREGRRIRKGHIHFYSFSQPEHKRGVLCWVARHPGGSILSIESSKEAVIQSIPILHDISWEEAFAIGARVHRRFAVLEIPPEQHDKFYI